MDARIFQAAVLLGLMAYGAVWLDLGLAPATALVIIITVVAVQFAGARLLALPFVFPASALITGGSLILLLRTNHLWVAALAAAVAVGSKFLVRANGKHIFNPSAFGLAVAVLVTGSAWISPGQWGATATFAFLLACAGGLVATRARTADITLAYLTAYAALIMARAVWLGDPLSIPVHQLTNGALVLFAFYMISDPKSTPDARAGRVLFAVLVAAATVWLQFGLHVRSAPIWALVALAPLVPLIDRLLPNPRFDWSDRPPLPPSGRTFMRHKKLAPVALAIFTLSALLWSVDEVRAFCGFYVAKADASLFNNASRVVLVRDEERTVLTMSNDFKGDPQEFAIVIPVPTFIEEGQIHVAENALIDHLDAYTAPRLVEYFDEDPCNVQILEKFSRSMPQSMPSNAAAVARARSLGVTIEASYTVGEYDILILSAEQSDGLATWLTQEGYKLPKGAARVLSSYIKQGMRFFVAKVNLAEQAKTGFTYLRPLQVAYESKKFMLPIRLGTLNADGPQELFIYTLTKKGRVETSNYRTVKLPTGTDIPVFVKDEFGDFYRDMFSTQVKKENMRAVFLEYAWDMNWCDPCAADPLSAEELRGLGVFWVGDAAPRDPRMRPQRSAPGGAQNVFVTRLHVRYDADRFPEDLMFNQTSDRENFQGRYVLRHPFTGEATCEAGEQYYETQLPERQEKEAQALANLTGWKIGDIRKKIGMVEPPAPKKWWERIWR